MLFLPHFYTLYASMLIVSPIVFLASTIALWIEFKRIQPVTLLALYSVHKWNMLAQTSFMCIPYSIMAITSIIDHFRRVAQGEMEHHYEVTFMYLSSVLGIIAQGALLPSTIQEYYWIIAASSTSQMLGTVLRVKKTSSGWKLAVHAVAALATAGAAVGVAVNYTVNGQGSLYNPTAIVSFAGLLDVYFHLFVYLNGAYHVWRDREKTISFFRTGIVAPSDLLSLVQAVSPTSPKTGDVFTVRMLDAAPQHQPPSALAKGEGPPLLPSTMEILAQKQGRIIV